MIDSLCDFALETSLRFIHSKQERINKLMQTQESPEDQEMNEYYIENAQDCNVHEDGRVNARCER